LADEDRYQQQRTIPFLRRLQRNEPHRQGMGVPESGSTGTGSRRRQNRTRPTRGSDGTDQKRRSSGYAGSRAAIARQPMASTRPRNPCSSRDDARRGGSADDARNRREI